MSKNYDIIIIGSGPSGYNAAVRAAQLGAKVAIIEKALLGGVCLNHGCIPTKFLWTALKRQIDGAKAYVSNVNMNQTNFQDIIQKKNKSIENIRKGMSQVLSSYDIDIIYATASFINKNTILIVENDKRLTYELHAEKMIIASGTQPTLITDLLCNDKKIINSNDILNIISLPSSILIIGGGPIGIEISTILAGFGCKVTLIEHESNLLPKEDIEISETIKKNLIRQGVTVITNCHKRIIQEESKKQYDKILVTVGRKPNNDVLHLENIGIKTNKVGFIDIDAFCQTNIKNIYAVGDVTGKNLLAYTAQNDGTIAATNAVKGNHITLDNSIIPLVVFSMPQSASVKISGFSQYQDVSIGKFPFSASVRAIIDSERIGFVKCIVDKFSKKPLAFWILGEHADEIINVASQILKSGAKNIQRETIFHPSLSETLLNAYEDAFSKCTELPKKIKKERK
jgi:dihydrolipoamide dehydrogenase